MAGAYKGLTIRIGADTTSMTRALRSANSVIYKTQSELTKLGKALKIDPGNQNAGALQLGRLSEQAGNYAHEIDVLKKGIGELGTTTTKHFKDGKLVDGENIAELASATKNVTLEAQKWADAYDNADKKLNDLYTKLNDAAGLQGEDKISNKNDNTDLESIKAVIEQTQWSIREQEEYLAAVERTKQAWNEASAEMENYADAAKLGELNDQLALMDSNIKKSAQDFASMTADTAIARSVGTLAERTELVSRAADTATDRFRRLDQSMKLNPNSLGTAIDRAQALSEATSTAREKARSLKDQLAAYKAEGIDAVANSTKNTSLAFERAKDNVARLKEQLERARIAEENASSYAGELAEKLRKAREEEGTASESAQKLAQQLDEARTSGGEAAEEVRNLSSALEDAVAVEERLGKANHYKELTTELREVQAESKAMRSALVSDLGGVGAAAVQAAVEVGNLMKQAGQKIVESSNEIDASYRDLRKTFDGTEEQYTQLYDAAMKYSQANVTSADKMLEMESIAAQLGVGLNEVGEAYAGSVRDIQHFAEVAANLDVATNIDAETIALQMGQIVNVMSDLSPENVHQFADALVNLGNKMPAQESAIMQITQRLSAIGDVANFSTPELLSWAAAIASTGQRSEAAASGISTTITNISKAVGTGGEALQKFAEVAHMSAEDFAAMWSDENGGASKALYAFVDGLGDLDNAGFQTLEDLGMSGVRQTQTLMALANTLENVKKAQDVANEGWYDGGQAAEEASRKAEGFSGSLSKMQNSAQILASTFGETLKPYLDLAAEAMNRLTDYINGLDEESKDAIVKWGVLTAGLATATPIVGALAGSFGTLFGNARRLAVGALTPLLVPLKAAKSVIVSFAKDATGTATALSSLGGTAGIVGKALGFIATPAGAAVTAIGALGLVVGGVYIKKLLDAKKRTDDLNEALSGMRSNTDDISRSLWNGSESVDKFSGSVKEMDESYSNVIESVKAHNDAQKETRSEAETNIGLLTRYKQIIDEAADAEDKSAVNKERLQYALNQLAEITGEQYDAEDLLNDKYKDESGTVKNLRDEIDKLIDAKKREAKADALKSMYTESIKNELELEKSYEDATKRVNEYREQFFESYRQTQSYQSGAIDDSWIGKRLNGDETFKNLRSNLADITDLLHGAQGESEELATAMTNLAVEEYTAADAGDHMRENMMRTNDAMSNTLDRLWDGKDHYRELAVAIEDAGVSVDDFASIAPKAFAAMAEQSGGDIESLTAMIAGLNDVQIENKELVITADDEGYLTAEDERIAWNGSEWVWQETGVKVDTKSLPAAKKQIDDTERSKQDMRNKSTKVTVSGNGITTTPSKNIEKVNTAAGNMRDTDATYTAKGNAATDGWSIANMITAIVNAAKGLSNKTVTYTTNQVTRKSTVNVPAGAANSATGTYIPYDKIPRHAAGIFTRPTLTNIGWVGEDGAELYSGNSLVPLTNRKYSMPYINDISDAVARKMGGAGKTTTINLSVTCEGDPNDTADAIVRALNLCDL